MSTIYAAYGLLSLLVVFLLYYSSITKYIKTTALTLLVIFGILVYSKYLEELGAPIDNTPSGEFVYVHHTVKGDWIYVWVWTEERGDRLHIVPYSQETAESLQGAKEETDKGQPQQGSFPQEGAREEEAPVFDDWVGRTGSYTK